MEINIIALKNYKGAKLGEQKTVRRGHARYLIRTKQALRYDKSDAEQFAQVHMALEKQETEQFEEARLRAEELERLSIRLSSRVSEKDHLYGSLGAKEIAEAIEKAGISIEKKAIQLPNGVIRQVGDHEVMVRLHDRVMVKITIQVIPA